MRPFPAYVLVCALFVASPALAEERPAPGPASDPASEADAGLDVADVVRRLKSKEGDERLVAATQSLEVADDDVTKPLGRLLTDDEFSVRAAAIRALAKRTSPGGKKQAAKALGVRLGKVAKAAHGAGEELLVIEALGELAQSQSVKPLFDGITDETTDEVFDARMKAVAEIPHASAIDELIKLLAKRGRGKWGGRKRSVVNALQAATGESFGGDPDDWRAWWKENEKSFDFAAQAERRESDAGKKEQREQRKREKKRRKKDGDGG